MNLTRSCVGLGLAALVTVTAACGSDSEKGGAYAEETGSSTEHTTATPDGAAMTYMNAMAARDFEAVCGVTNDGEAPIGATQEGLDACVEMLEMLMSDQGDAGGLLDQVAQAIADGPSKVEELSATTAVVTFAAANDGEPTNLTKIGDAWYVNLLG